MAYNDEPHREILEGLVPYNPDLPIIDARPFGKKRSLLITLATGPLPNAIRFWAGIHTCFPHRPKSRSVLQLPPHRAPPRHLSGPSKRKLSQLRRPSRPDRASNMLTEVYRMRGRAPHRER
ncbi:hypothetical protein MTO96_028256 [Rhipicephalus appendiculatus]